MAAAPSSKRSASGTGSMPPPPVTAQERPPAPLTAFPPESHTPPSSISPSQSSSSPLQISIEGDPGVHDCGFPAAQLGRVRWQTPTPQVVEPSPSSIWPSQLSSTVTIHGE
jgi:hypothetical protein